MFYRPVVFAFGSLDVFTANFVMSTLPPDDLSQTSRNTSVIETKAAHRKRDKSATEQSRSDSKNLTIKLSDVIDLDAEDYVHIPTTVAPTVPSQSNLLNSSATYNGRNIPDRTLATTVTSQYNPPTRSLNNNRRSCSPNHESLSPKTIPKGTESEEICVTFRPESDTGSGNNDEEMEVIPLSPQPERRRRFKVFPRLYQNTQQVSGNRVLHEHTDDEHFDD